MSLARNTKLLLLSLFFIGVGLIYYSKSLEKPVPLSNISNYVGEVVLVEGFINKTYTNKYGTKIIVLCDNVTCTRRYYYGNKELNCTRLKVKGIVSKYYNYYNIKVYNSNWISCLKT